MSTSEVKFLKEHNELLKAEVEDLKKNNKLLSEENNDLFYKVVGVMHSVDKCLDNDEMKEHEVTRGFIMREKVLQIIEELEEKVDDSFIKGAKHAFYEICKELDIPSEDIRRNNYSIEETAIALSIRIKEVFGL